MIVTQLLGGIGNQFFQYAIGRALACKHCVPLRLDTAPFKHYHLRTYALEHFAIEGEILSDTERNKLGLNRLPRGRVVRAVHKLFGRSSIPVIHEEKFEFDASILDAPPSCYLQGYWQSPKYFATIEPHIRQELTCRHALTGRNAEFAARIASCQAVSLHLRRGDYVTSARTSQYHGTCGPDYYTTAEALLRERVGALELFVFSDDPDWAEANLHFPSPAIYLRHNGPERDYEDLRLMTLCKHHIIANSTFSWWGAWLCQNPGKLVIAPRNWFKEANHSTADLIPDSWIRL